MSVRWGFLGAGRIARVLATAVQGTGDQVLQAVGARDAARAAALDPVRAYGSYEPVLADPDVDAVYVALPNDAHLPWTLAALRAGKDVLCEKPLGLTAAEVDQMAAAAAQSGRRVVEASWYRWHPRVRLAQELLPRIGPVRHVAAGFTARLDLEGDYRSLREHGGGALYDVGCYAVSACLWAVGRGVPDDVVARTEPAASGVDLDTRAILAWEPTAEHPGAEAEVHAGLSADRGQWLVVRGDAGELELRGAPFTSGRGEDTELWLSDGTSTERLPVPAADPYVRMLEEVGSSFRGGDGWVLPLEESRQTAAVLDACFASAVAGGEPVRP
ncbi:MAG TPA: Gfo/Idh/MocA family oxidoreductase [Mycobacteriales bacterium]|nr:Gfo/Idh/MocA family oxidoreductase [Mycobacteriales bacterium]